MKISEGWKKLNFFFLKRRMMEGRGIDFLFF
jgi:hypothetical protein